MKTERDDSGNDPGNRALLDRYQQASAALDERPAASARASILAAAAREVGARPVDAAARRPIRQRWPLAAAAAVMLSTLAVMLAIRTNEEMPQFSAPAQAPRGAADNAAPPAAPPASSPPPMADLSAGKLEEPQRQVTESRPAKTRERLARAQSEADAVAKTPREANRPALNEAPSPPRVLKKEAAQQNVLAAEKENARQSAPAAFPATAAAPEPAARAKARTEPSAAGAVAAAPIDQASADSRRDAGRTAAPASPSVAQVESKQQDDSAAAWLERIIKLRREGRHEEADAELKRFRERYPQVQPPAEALLPAGTR